MKTKNLLIIFTFFINYTFAQSELWSMTQHGGPYNSGAIFKTILDGTIYTRVYDFKIKYPGSHPMEGLCRASNGKFYGSTVTGGTNDRGVIYSYDTLTNTYADVFDFDSLDWFNPNATNISGALPSGTLIQAANGKLYGLTSQGGVNNNNSMSDGVLYSYDPVSSTYTKLFDFDSINGSGPNSSLLEGADGKLYGTTSLGGAYNAGVIFNFDTSSSTVTKLYDFNGITMNGTWIKGRLLQATNGLLYGLSSSGGIHNNGMLFSYDLINNSLTDLVDFDFNNNAVGSFPYGSLIQAPNGKLYGVNSISGFSGTDGGILFSFDPVNNSFNDLHYFDCVGGCQPFGTLMVASDGKLYGTTSGGGTNGNGVIFNFNITTNTYSKLFDFNYPVYGGIYNDWLIQGSGLKFYGITNGGSNNEGAIISYDASTNTFQRNIDFNYSEGVEPTGSLMQASNGLLYGMTTRGGEINSGVIFSLDPITENYTRLYDFNNSLEGAFPQGSLIQATNGKLYGMTTNGGDNFYPVGTTFSFDPVSNVYAYLDLYYCTTGLFPYGDLIQASNGNFYGLISQGLPNCTGASGTIFSTDPLFTGYSNNVFFSGANGAAPYGSLMQATNGNFYGMTSSGGSLNFGTLFSYNLDSISNTVLHNFDSINGSGPTGNVIEATNGKLYGMTPVGGLHNAGIIFSYDTLNFVFTKLFDFDSINGADPNGSLFEASNGKLYGMTKSGGTYNAGVVFNFDPLANSFTKLKDLQQPDGTQPIYSNFIEIGTSAGIAENKATEKAMKIYPSPAVEQFIIQFNSEVSTAQLEIFNAFAEKIYSTELSGRELIVNCKNFTRGIYFVKVNNAEKQWIEKLVIE